MKRAVAAVLTLLAVALLALHVTLTYALTSEYGFVAADLQPVDGLVLLLVSCLALLLLLGARGQIGARRPRTAVLAVTVLAVFAGSAATSAALGGATHARRTATVASACSAEDRQVLAAVDVPGHRDGPRGGPDGGCTLHLFPEEPAGTVITDLSARLEDDGWQPARSGGGTAALERDGALLVLSTVSDDKATEIVVTLH